MGIKIKVIRLRKKGMGIRKNGMGVRKIRVEESWGEEKNKEIRWWREEKKKRIRIIKWSERDEVGGDGFSELLTGVVERAVEDLGGSQRRKREINESYRTV